MKLTILGCHSATPKASAYPTAQVLEIRGHLFLIDCGEGTQMQLRRTKVKFSRIKHIFISHLHGDHFFGLIGLISTFRLLGREAEMHIYGPKGIKEIIMLQLKLSASHINYPLHFHELETQEPKVLFEDEKVTVRSFPLSHRVYTNGFHFQEKPGERKLNHPKAVQANIHHSLFSKLKQGFDVENENGETISNDSVTDAPDPALSYAYCSDTEYFPAVIPHIANSTALYHEATFLEEHAALAEKTKHSTAKEAAVIAKKAAVGTLILGHFSGRYRDLSVFQEQAMEIFPNTQLAEDGKSFEF